MTDMILAAILAAGPAIAGGMFPEDHRALTRTIPFAETEEFLKSLDGKGPVSVSVEGRSVKGRPLYLVRLKRGKDPSWRIFIYAQQHGDEVSGKDALLYLIRDIARDPKRLSPDVELWLMPSVNPDGGEAGDRMNGAGADLNRDHMTLDQPETRALHRVAQRVRPHVSIDSHEFTRDRESFLKRGWLDWREITMDGLNQPLFDAEVKAAALRWVVEAEPVLREAGHAYGRYCVGGPPPEDELRHSTSDADDGRNSLGFYGGLSFIIEAGARRATGGPVDLGNRVDAYLALYRSLIAPGPERRADLAAVERARKKALPAYIPTDSFWARLPDTESSYYPVIETATGGVLRIPAPNLMTHLMIKKSVPAPGAYVIEAPAAELYRALLDRHAIPYEVLSATRTFRAERCALTRMEDEFDELYNRYEGRQIVSRGEATDVEAAPGSLLVSLKGEHAARAVAQLEPLMLYGMFRYPAYRALVRPGKPVPILRVP